MPGTTRKTAQPTKAPAAKAAEETAPKQKVVKLRYERDTKGTHVYSAADDANAAIMRTQYVGKGTFGADDAPEEITVTIAW